MVFIGGEKFVRAITHSTVHSLFIYYSCQESYSDSVRVRNPVDTLFISLCASEHCSRHCGHQNTVHVTVDQFFTAKIVTALFTTLFT